METTFFWPLGMTTADAVRALPVGVATLREEGTGARWHTPSPRRPTGSPTCSTRWPPVSESTGYRSGCRDPGARRRSAGAAPVRMPPTGKAKDGRSPRNRPGPGSGSRPPVVSTEWSLARSAVRPARSRRSDCRVRRVPSAHCWTMAAVELPENRGYHTGDERKPEPGLPRCGGLGLPAAAAAAAAACAAAACAGSRPSRPGPARRLQMDFDHAAELPSPTSTPWLAAHTSEARGRPGPRPSRPACRHCPS